MRIKKQLNNANVHGNIKQLNKGRKSLLPNQEGVKVNILTARNLKRFGLCERPIKGEKTSAMTLKKQPKLSVKLRNLLQNLSGGS